MFNDSSNGINGYTIKSFFWNQINYDVFFHDYKTFPFAVIYRFIRCNEYDQQVLPNWFLQTAAMLGEFMQLFPNDSAPTHDLINYSELLVKLLPNGSYYLPGAQAEIDWADNALLDNEGSEMMINTTNSYKIENYLNADLLYKPDINTWHKISDSEHNRLLLHGNMDFNAPYFQDTKFNERYHDKSNWNLVTFPLIGHTPTFYGSGCVWDVIMSFLNGNGDVNKVETGCVDRMPTNYDFAAETPGVQQASMQIFGVPNPFQ